MAILSTYAHRPVKSRKLGWAEKPASVVPLDVQRALRAEGVSDANRP